MYSLYNLIHYLDDPFAFLCIVLIFGLSLAVLNKSYTLSLVLSLGNTALVTFVLKHLFQVPRPDDMILFADGYRFPSMHASVTSAIVGAGVCSLNHALITSRTLKRYPSWIRLSLRFAQFICGSIVIGIVCISRVKLQVHEPIDVIVGAVIGVSIACLISLLVIPKTATDKETYYHP
jgi:membrane-associated phospholipid phosphatase